MVIKKVVMLLLGILCLSLVSASVVCDNHIIFLSYNQTSIPAGDIAITSCNSANSTPINFNGGEYIYKGDDMISISGTKNLKIKISSSIPEGTYTPYFSFENSENVYVILTISKAKETDPTSCQINPSLVSYQQQIQQGTKIPLSKITFSPINCGGQLVLTASSVSMQGGVVTPEGQKPVFISSVESDGINVEIDTEGLNSQTYNSKLKISAFNKVFEIPFTIIVTGGTSGGGNLDVNNLPKCSLTNTIISTNETYSLVCTNLVPDISIVPIIDDEYIKGIGYEKESNQESWMFQAKKFGNTLIKVGFYYLGKFPVGDFYRQEIKIQSSSGQIPGTNLKFLFTPRLENANENEQVLIQLIDNKTNSLVENPEIYIDAIKIVPMDNSSKTFPFKFSSGRNYDIRGKAPGYNDLIKTINITSTPITITLNPVKEIYYVGEVLAIATNINASLFLNDVAISSPYTFTSAGNYTLKAVKDGYTQVNKSILVKEVVRISTCDPEYEDWKKGKRIVCELSRNATWNVYLDSTSKESGTGNLVDFRIDDYGIWEIKSDEISLVLQHVENSGWYKFWRWRWYYQGIFYVIIAGAGGYFLFFRGRENEDEYEQPIGSE